MEASPLDCLFSALGSVLCIWFKESLRMRPWLCVFLPGGGVPPKLSGGGLSRNPNGDGGSPRKTREVSYVFGSRNPCGCILGCAFSFLVAAFHPNSAATAFQEIPAATAVLPGKLGFFFFPFVALCFSARIPLIFFAAASFSRSSPMDSRVSALFAFFFPLQQLIGGRELLMKKLIGGCQLLSHGLIY
ncbi:hypothetical protein Droror1_Dr00017350 [Drosera rotundifolia]